MKAAVISYLNDIVSLTVLTLMAVALIAGQLEAANHVAEGLHAPDYQVVLEVRHK